MLFMPVIYLSGIYAWVACLYHVDNIQFPPLAVAFLLFSPSTRWYVLIALFLKKSLTITTMVDMVFLFALPWNSVNSYIIFFYYWELVLHLTAGVHGHIWCVSLCHIMKNKVSKKNIEMFLFWKHLLHLLCKTDKLFFRN